MCLAAARQTPDAKRAAAQKAKAKAAAGKRDAASEATIKVRAEKPPEAAASPTELPAAVTVADVKFNLVNPQGEFTPNYAMSASKTAPLDFLFRATVPERYNDYVGYAYEVSDPVHNLNYQIELDGKVPSIVHWDGWFTASERVKPNQQYFVRIALLWTDGRVVTSLWSPFETKLEGREKTTRLFKGNTLSLFLVPSGSLAVMQVRTLGSQSGYLPTVSGDLRLIFKEVHTLGFRLEASNTIFFNFRTPELGLYYSDISVFYRYRLAGAAPRHPQLNYVPAYAKDNVQEDKPSRRLYGKSTNIEIGAKYFATTIRGISGTVIDGEYARSFQGLSGHIYIDHQFWPLRVYAMGEGGYSLFQGRLSVLSGEAGIGLDSIPAVIPYIFGRYQMISGTTAPSGGAAGIAVRNTILYAGLALVFRI